VVGVDVDDVDDEAVVAVDELSVVFVVELVEKNSLEELYVLLSR